MTHLPDFLFDNQSHLWHLISNLYAYTYWRTDIFLHKIPCSFLRGFHALAISVPAGAKFRNIPSACGGFRNFEDLPVYLMAF